MKVLKAVLRLGHRPERDKRMTTHVGLTARAFGADIMYMPKADKKIENTLSDVTERFGGNFQLKEEKDWRELVKNWDGDIIHLTMYGEDIDKFFEDEKKLDDPLIIIGAEKVPREVYDMSDYNIAVGSEPHSEVAALAVFMDRLNERKIDSQTGGKISVLPTTEGKRVVNYSKIPSARKCYEYLDKIDMDDGVIEQSLDVLERSLELHDKFGGDLKLIVAGALLHDVGRSVTHGVEHGIEGGKIARDEGWHEELAKIIERHIGGGITKEEAKEQDIPVKDYVPESLEEKIICHADNTASGKERFDDLIKRTEEAGFKASADRMRELSSYFEEEQYLEE